MFFQDAIIPSSLPPISLAFSRKTLARTYQRSEAASFIHVEQILHKLPPHIYQALNISTLIIGKI